MKESCETCRFSQLVKDAGSTDLAALKADARACRRYPPTLSAFLVPAPGGVSIGQAVGFPPVAADGWCGEFQAIP